MVTENPKAVGYTEMYQKCRECARCDPASRRSPFNKNGTAYGCDMNHMNIAKGGNGCDNSITWPNFVPYSPAVKVGDHVKITKSIRYEGYTGVIVVISNDTVPYKVRIDQDGKEWWVQAVEVGGGSDKDYWTPRAAPGLRAEYEIGGVKHVYTEKVTQPVVEKADLDDATCYNCGHNMNASGSDDILCQIGAGGKCSASRLASMLSKCDAPLWVPRVVRKPGYEGNEAPPVGMSHLCPAHDSCVEIVWECEWCGMRSKDVSSWKVHDQKCPYNPSVIRAEQAEKARDESVAKRATLEKRVEELEELKSAPLIETLAKEVKGVEEARDSYRQLAGDLQQQRDALKDAVARWESGAMYNTVEAERNSLRRVSAEREAQNMGLKRKVAELTSNGKCVGFASCGHLNRNKSELEAQLKDRVDFVNHLEGRITGLEAQLAKYKKELDDAGKLFITKSIERNAEIAANHVVIEQLKKHLHEQPELTSLKEMLAKEANRFCIQCGTPYRVEEAEPKAVVPRWAHKIDDPTCRKCKNASRLTAFLNPSTYPCTKPCMAETYDEYKPRTTRSARKAASLAGKLKAAEKARKETLEALHKMDEAYLVLKQKGVEAVARTAEKDLAVLNKERADHDEEETKLKKQLAASVPLSNALPLESIDSKPVQAWNDGTYFQELTIRLPRGFSSVNPRRIVVYEKAKEATSKP